MAADGSSRRLIGLLTAGSMIEERTDDPLVRGRNSGPRGPCCLIVSSDECREQQAARFASEQQLGLESEQ
jgi:hypothetical protein